VRVSGAVRAAQRRAGGGLALLVRRLADWPPDLPPRRPGLRPLLPAEPE
jgi:hypothetical protein